MIKACSFSGVDSIQYPSECFKTYLRVSEYFKRLLGADNVISECCPTRENYIATIADPEVKMYFCGAHGDSSGFDFGYHCPSIYYRHIEEAMANRAPIPLILMLHCHAMNETGEGTLTHAFTKGLNQDVVVIGTKHVTLDPCCPCEAFSLIFLPYFLETIINNPTKKLKEIYDEGVDLCPEWMPDHIEFVGDETLTLERILYEPELELEQENLVSIIGLLLLSTIAAYLLLKRTTQVGE